MRRVTSSLWLVVCGTLVVAGCGSSEAGGGAATGTGEADCPAGTERCPCYGNGTCNAELVCASDVCVILGAGGAEGVGGGAAGVGGSPAGVGGSPAGVGGSPAGVGGSPAGVGGSPAGLGGASGTGGAGSACPSVSLQFDLVRISLVFIYNSSGTMDGKWLTVRDGFIAFLNEPESRPHYASLEFFPAAGDLAAVCNVTAYETPAVELTALDTITLADSPFLTAINEITPVGGEPTLPALLGTLNYARTVRAENPDSATVVVMITDGLPAFLIDGEAGPGCTDPLENTTQNTATIAAAGLADGIPTHVIALGAQDGLSALSQIALAGGTEAAAFIASAGLQGELAGIRRQYQSCSVPVPQVQSLVDWDQATVLATVDGLSTILNQTPGCPSGLGWQYLYGPDYPDTPTHIEFCPTTCGTIQGTPNLELSLDFECVAEDAS